MSDFEQLLLILAAFYTLECVFWTRPGSFIFTSQLGERHRPRTPERAALLQNGRGGLLFGNLLPLGSSFAVEPWPFAASPEGVAAGDRFVPFAELRADAEGRTIRVNGTALAAAASAGAAEDFAAQLRRWAKLPSDERGPAIERELAASLDPGAVRERAAAALVATGWVQTACTMLLLYAFAVLPVLSVRKALPEWWRVGATYLILLALVLLTTFLAHRSVRRGRSGERAKVIFTALVSPADAIHARDAVLRDALGDAHPLAVAAAVAPRSAFVELARATVLAMRFPTPAEEPPDESQAVVAWFRERLLRATEACVTAEGLDPSEWLREPVPETADCRSFCRRCRGQYHIPVGDCTLCALPLRPFGVTTPEPMRDLVPVTSCPPASTAPAKSVVPAAKAKKRKRRK